MNFFKRKRDTVKRERFDSTGEFQQHFRSIVEASYAVSFIIAMQYKPYTIGETLIKPCASKMARIVLGEESEMKLQQIPLSNNTVQRRIVELSDNEIHNSDYSQFNLIKLPTLSLVSNFWCFADMSQTLFGNSKGPVELGNPNTCAETKLCLNFILFRLKK